MANTVAAQQEVPFCVEFTCSLDVSPTTKACTIEFPVYPG